jgi:hypothetical protein
LFKPPSEKKRRSQTKQLATALKGQRHPCWLLITSGQVCPDWRVLLFLLVWARYFTDEFVSFSFSFSFFLKMAKRFAARHLLAWRVVAGVHMQRSAHVVILI